MNIPSRRTIDIAPESMSRPIAPLLQPDLRILYPHRAKRLRALMAGHAMKDYLLFAADIVDAQNMLLQNQPFKLDAAHEPLLVDWRTPPLSKQSYPRDRYWLHVLDALLEHLMDLPQYHEGIIGQAIKSLRDTDAVAKEKAADLLLTGDVTAAGSDGAPFYWAALSLYWAQLARAYKLNTAEEPGVERHFCPVCGSEPVASVITLGPPDGLRYLHCNLCETQWHYVRAQCSNCEQSGKVEYWALDDKDAAVRAESCGDCHSYLKVVYENRDLNVDPVADDLASIALDAHMEEQGFARSAVNPFLFPAPQ